MDLRQARAIFYDESRELCDTLEAALLDRARYVPGPETYNLMFRTAHTIKGSAGMFGLEALVRFAHAMENVLERLRSGRLDLDEGLTSVLLECNDHLRALLAASEQDENSGSRDLEGSDALLTRLLAYQDAAGSALSSALGSSRRPWLLSLRFHSDLLREGFDPLAFLHYLGQMGHVRESALVWRDTPPLQTLDLTECLFGLDMAYISDASIEEIRSAFEFIEADNRICIFTPDSTLPQYLDWLRALDEPRADVLVRWVTLGIITTAEAEALASGLPAPPQVASAAPSGGSTRPASAARTEGQYIRIEAAKLDRLINRVGELVIAASATTVMARQRCDSELLESVAAINNLVEGIRDDALTLRMVPVNDIFSRFPRLVREVAHQLGKDIHLDIVGADTEIDKSMVEKLTDPLLHIVRNALDHGLEAPAQRLEAGKPATGRLTLEAYHEAGSVVVEVRDDGRGIDRQRVLAKAVERGLVPEGRVLADQDILQLIFLPGFSTAETVSDLSGRGVGMDVVKRHIDLLRGEIDISTEPGRGTTFKLRLPLTLAIIDGFLIEVDQAAMVIPVNMMLECLELPADALQHRLRQINVRDEWVPYVCLRELFGLESSTAPQYVVLVNFGEHRAGIVVDRLVGELQAVIKPMGQMFRSLRGFSGSTILGNGKPALILDIPQLIHYAGRAERRQIEENALSRLQVATGHGHR